MYFGDKMGDSERQANHLAWKKAATLSGVLVVGGLIQMIVSNMWEEDIGSVGNRFTPPVIALKIGLSVAIIIVLTFVIALTWKRISD